MARYKTTKRAAKRQPATAHQMGKEIFAAPAKLIARLDKEISALKKKENKFKNASTKLHAKAKKSENRVKAADKLKHTSAGKKRLKKVQKSHNEIIKSQNSYSKQLQDIIHSLEISQQNQSKLIALGKHLNQFEKEWAKNSKKAKTQVTAAKSKPKKSTAKAKKAAPAMDMLKTDSHNMALDHARHEETADVVS